MKLLIALLLPVFAFASSIDDRFVAVRNNHALRSVNGAGSGFVSLIKSNTANKVVLTTSHIKTAQATPPSALVNANAGTGGACTLTTSTDAAGIINLTIEVGLVPDNLAGTQCVLTFDTPYDAAPVCTISAVGPTPDPTTALGAYPETTTTTLTLGANNTPFITGTYLWKYSYTCIEATN